MGSVRCKGKCGRDCERECEGVEMECGGSLKRSVRGSVRGLTGRVA